MVSRFGGGSFCTRDFIASILVLLSCFSGKNKNKREKGKNFLRTCGNFLKKFWTKT